MKKKKFFRQIMAKIETWKEKRIKFLDIWSGYEKSFILYKTEEVITLPPAYEFVFRIIKCSIEIALKIVRDEPFKGDMMWMFWGEYPVKLKETLKMFWSLKNI